MNKIVCLLVLVVLYAMPLRAQEVLPGITVTNFSGKILISWKNAYKLPVANISIQRSYDSLKNYSTIGSVLNPQNEENGYTDNNPPYNKMYYRVFIAFEGGSYIISPAVRPVKAVPAIADSLAADTSASIKLFPWQVDPRRDSTFQPPPPPLTAPVVKNEIIYPSQRIFTSRDNTIVIHLPGAATKKFTAKFFNDAEKQLFELTSLKEEYLILEKVNFRKAGWYYFELYEDGKLLEKNKFIVPKDGKNGFR